MIARYTNPEMGAIWSDQRRYETWLAVELAAVDAMAEVRHRACRGRARAAREGVIRHRAHRCHRAGHSARRDAFTTAVAERAGPRRAMAAFGMTSSDVLDTARRSRCAKPVG